ncbi:hypothetical protein Q8A73_021782 [Channa argus]|nr:hypothetical protein Q8A73_021782 [Channa argus]
MIISAFRSPVRRDSSFAVFLSDCVLSVLVLVTGFQRPWAQRSLSCCRPTMAFCVLIVNDTCVLIPLFPRSTSTQFLVLADTEY